MTRRRVEVEIDELVLAGIPPGWDRHAVARAISAELSERTAQHGISERVVAGGVVDAPVAPGIAAAATPGEYGRQLGATISKGLSR